MLDTQTKIRALLFFIISVFFVTLYQAAVPSFALDINPTQQCEPTSENPHPLTISGNWAEGKTTITNTSNVCSFKVWTFSTRGTLPKSDNTDWLHAQTYYDSKSYILGPAQKVDMLVNLPECGLYYQLSVVRGEFAEGFPTGQQYTDKPLLWSEYGMHACPSPSATISVSPVPSVTTTTPTATPVIATNTPTQAATPTSTPTPTQVPASNTTNSQNSAPTATPTMTLTPTPTTSQKGVLGTTNAKPLVYASTPIATTPTTGAGTLSLLLLIPSAVGGFLLRKKY